jgi:AcrR family transcriptional regulator
MLPTEVLSEHHRSRVIEAAVAVFARRGYQSTTVDDLLASARMGAGNFYSLFQGKEECFLAAFDLVVERARTEIASAASPSEDWAEQTYLGLGAAVGYVLANPLAGRLVLESAFAWLAHGRDVGGADLPASWEHAAVPGLAFYLQQCVLDPRSHDRDTLVEETSTLLLEPMIGRERLAAVRRAVSAPPS